MGGRGKGKEWGWGGMATITCSLPHKEGRYDMKAKERLRVDRDPAGARIGAPWGQWVRGHRDKQTTTMVCTDGNVVFKPLFCMLTKNVFFFKDNGPGSWRFNIRDGLCSLEQFLQALGHRLSLPGWALYVCQNP